MAHTPSAVRSGCLEYSCHHNLLPETKFARIEIRNDQGQHHEDQGGSAPERWVAGIQELPLDEVTHQDDLPPAENIRDDERTHDRDEYQDGPGYNARHRQRK